MAEGGDDSSHGITRREFVKAAGAAGVAVGLAALAGCDVSQRRVAAPTLAAGGGPPGRGPYNILFILTDQERYFAKYPRGYSLPGRERLMRHGVTFTNTQICTAVCTPSRSVILTGQHIQHTRMFDNTNFPWVENLSTDIPTIGHMLRKMGYYTAYQGKWHLHQGMHESKPLKGELADPKIMEAYGFADYVGGGDIIGMTLGGYHFDHFVAATAGTWLRKRGRPLSAEGKPWFLAIGFVNPHDVMFYDTDLPGKKVQGAQRTGSPISREPPHAIYRQKWDMPLSPTRKQRWDEKGRPPAHLEYQNARQFLVGRFPNEDGRWKRLQDYYLNCIRDCDRSVELLLKELDDLGLTKSTIVILTSDHGELCGAHGMHGKGATAFREQNHVPLIISHPAIRGGKRCRAVTSHLDLVPTIVGLTGMGEAKKKAITKDLKGKDISPLLRAPEKAPLAAVRAAGLYCYNMWSSQDADFIGKAMPAALAGKKPPAGLRPDFRKRGAIRTVFDGRYKFSRYFAPLQHNRPRTMEQILRLNDLELYDLESDPYEMRNLAVDPKKAGDLIMAMNEKLNALIDEEVGEDVGQMLPKAPGVSWAITKFDP
ncbi:MAG: sulfatase-like hydrolase/transferase [Planctomycetota bacterium]|jgi:arylsulfatase